MTTPQPKPVVSGTVLVLGMVAVFCFTIAAVVVVAVAVPEGGNPGSLIALMLAVLAPTLTGLANLAKTSNVEQRVEQVAQETADLGNGKMDAKIRAGVADVVHSDYLDPEAGEQIAADRERRNGS